jgi:hypothetical protein
MEEADAQISLIDERLERKTHELRVLKEKMAASGDFDDEEFGRRGSVIGDGEDGEKTGRRGRMGLEWQREIAIRNRNETWNARQARLIAQKRLQFDVAKLQEERRLAEARSQRLSKMDMQRVEQYKFRVKTDLLNKNRERHIEMKEERWMEAQRMHTSQVLSEDDEKKEETFQRIKADREAKIAEFNRRLHSKRVLNRFMDVARAAREQKTKASQKAAVAREMEKLEEWKRSRDVEKAAAPPATCVIERYSIEKGDLDAKREEKIREREAARNERAVRRYRDAKERPLVGLGMGLQGATEKAIVRGDISLYYLSSIVQNDEESSDEEHIL